MKIRSIEFLTVGEAAKLLGMSRDTILNLEKKGKLKPARHVLNNYRIYRREDLERLLNEIENGAENSRKKCL